VPKSTHETLSKKESQAMEVLYRLGEASAAQVQQELPGGPGYSATRALLGVLVDKGLARAWQPDGARHYLYAAAEPLEKARKGALSRLMSTFFEDSPSRLVASLLDARELQISAGEIEKMQRLIDEHRQLKS
jgi:BlaI family transcriptional regulator, penicillinase repressor